SDAHRLELLAYGSDDRVQVVFDENEPQGNTEARLTGVNFGNSVYRGQLRWTWRPEGPVQNTMMASYGVNSTRLRVADNLFFDGSFYQLQVRDDFEWKIASNLTLNAGADIQAGTTRYSFEFPRLRDSTDQNPDGQGGGRPNLSPQGAVGTRSSPLIRPAGYVEVSYRPVENLELIPGLRFDYYGDVEQASVSPRGKVRYEISDEWTAKAGVGLFTQPPLPNETEPQFGNPGLTFEKAIHYSAGAVWEPLPFLELDATLYYRDLNDLVQQTLDRQRDPETGELENEIYDNSGRGRSYGLELLVRHKPANRFFGWVAYTLSRSERWDRRAGEYVPFQYDQTHNLTAVAGYELPKNWSVSGRFRLVTGNPYTPVVGGVYNADLGKYEKVFGRRNSRRTATFDQLDLRIDKKWVFDRWELGAYLDVINVYNAKNQEGVQYNFDFSERAPIRGLPLIPTLGLTGRY
ncbi:MAG: TonB-dependent receptor plug domain-containing protein, partial [Bradymonadaceae bacterium]